MAEKNSKVEGLRMTVPLTKLSPSSSSLAVLLTNSSPKFNNSSTSSSASSSSFFSLRRERLRRVVSLRLRGGGVSGRLRRVSVGHGDSSPSVSGRSSGCSSPEVLLPLPEPSALPAPPPTSESSGTGFERGVLESKPPGGVP